MIFNEQYFINLKNIPNVFIYFLIKNDQVVYVGQTKQGTSRIHSHYKNKKFDNVYIIPCNESQLDELEGYYIEKYTPIYNNSPNPNYTHSVGNVIEELNTIYASRNACIKHPNKFNKNRIDKIMKKLKLSYLNFKGRLYIKHNDRIIISDKIEEYIMGVETDEIFNIGF